MKMESYLNKIEHAIHKYPLIDGWLRELEKRTNVKKVYLASGVVASLTLWLVFGYGAELLCNAIGFVYPAYCSIKAIESKTKNDDVQWLMYWVVFSIFSVVEFFSDCLVGWVPCYWLSKCLFLIWCMSPLDGSTLIYQKFVVPVFRRNQSSIDNVLDKTKQKLSSVADEVFNQHGNGVLEDKKSD